MIVDENIELALLKRRRAELLKQKITAIKNDGLKYYKPHSKQDAFHRSTAKRRGVFAGNRFGKSMCGCAEDCAWLRNERPWVEESDLARRSGIPQRPVKGIVLTTNWDKVDEVYTSNRGTEGKLWQFLPRDGFVKRTTRNHEGKICIVECANGSVLRFATVRSWLNDPQSVESTDYDFVHIDEPIPEQMWKGVSRGLVDRDGFAWFTLTALTEPWIVDAFLPDGAFKDSMFKIEGSIYDNPTLTPQAIAMFEASLSADERECRLWGKPLHLAGLVYKSFRYDKHVLQSLPRGWKSFAEPPTTWSHYYYIDPHPRTPNAVLLLAVDPFERLFFFRDIFERTNMRELAILLHQSLDGRHLVRGRGDPLMFITDPETDKTWADDLAVYGFPVDKAIKDPLHGIMRVNELLSEEKPRIFFSPECRRTLWEIQRYHWDEETGKPVDADDHMMENLYRAVLDEPCYCDPKVYERAIGDEVIDKPRLDLEKLNLTL